MNRGKISYSPDYKSEKPLNSRVKIRPSGQPYVDAAELVESRLKRLAAADVSTELARLERAVIGKAKEFTSNDEARDHWDALVCYRELCGVVDALLTFESEQEKKS